MSDCTLTLKDIKRGFVDNESIEYVPTVQGEGLNAWASVPAVTVHPEVKLTMVRLRETQKLAEAEFDRWLAEYTAEVRAQALEDAADAFHMARINVAIFGDSPEAHWWGGANSARDRLVESLRARAEKERQSGNPTTPTE